MDKVTAVLLAQIDELLEQDGELVELANGWRQSRRTADQQMAAIVVQRVEIRKMLHTLVAQLPEGGGTAVQERMQRVLGLVWE